MNVEQRIRALLAHAESAAMLGNVAEADTYQDKALDMMAEHAVTQAMLNTANSDHRSDYGVATITITAAQLPSPYSLEHGYGILKLARALGGYGLMTRWSGSRLPTQLDMAITDPEPFRRLSLGLAAICAATVALRQERRLERASFIRGFWDGCAAAATQRVTQYENKHGSQSGLIPVRDRAKETITEALANSGDIRHRKAPPSAHTYIAGRDVGRDTYRSFGRALNTNEN
ncbi:MAG: DUF2786 domain-containing protein [Propionibacteriaceae bacterium]|nr:DUF2786 domain-containing protein [Propionibacteriaceae bacterium]